MELVVSAHERRCLELAWDACAAGTVGVGAVLVGAAGDVLAEGNNGIFAPTKVGPLSDTRIAHAEMNVFAQLTPGTDTAGATLYTSLEPCPMCAGAIILHDLAGVQVIARDPLVHDIEAIGDRNEWIRSRFVERTFTNDAAAVRLATLFGAHPFFFWFDKEHSFVRATRENNAAMADWLSEIADSTILVQLAADGASLDDVIAALEPSLAAEI